MWEIIIVFLVSFLLYNRWINRNFYRLLVKIPGPSLMCQAKDFLKMHKSSFPGSEFLKIVQRNAQIYKTPFKYWCGYSYFIFIIKPEDFKVVLNTPHCLNRIYVYNFLKRFAGNGLAFLRTPEWKFHRKHLNPALSLKACRSFLPVFNKQAKVLVSCLEKVCDKKEATDISHYTKLMAYDTIFETSMGECLNLQNNPENDYTVKYANKINEVVAIRAHNPFIHLEPIYRLTSLYREEIKGVKYIRGEIDKFVKERKSYWLENLEEIQKTISDQANEEESKTPMTFIDQLFNLIMIEKKFNECEIIENSVQMIAGGYETTGLSSAYCILMLAMFPHYQQKVYEEIKLNMFEKNGDIYYEDLSKYEFLDRFIKETLRLFPAVPVIFKELSEEIQLDKYTIPKGVYFGCSIFLLHRNKEVWGPSAEEFDPDHFLPENVEKRHPYAYLPFSGGARNCIGIKYSYMILKVILIHVVNNYKLHTDLKFSDLEVEVELSLNLFNKHMVSIEKRDN